MLGTASVLQGEASLGVIRTSIIDGTSIRIMEARLKTLQFARKHIERWGRTCETSEAWKLRIYTVSFNNDFGELEIPGSH